MQIILAADHGGFAAKETLKSWLQAQNHEILDAGAFQLLPDDDFPDYVAAAVQIFRTHPASRLILWCRSGVGVDIAANRHPGIYCGLACSPEQIAAATRDDHLNALALASDCHSLDEQKALINSFLNTAHHEAPRFARRLAKLDSLLKGQP